MDNGASLNSTQANGNLTRGGELVPGLKASIRADVQVAAERLLEALRIDWRNDHNTRGTPERIARMLVDEVCRGRYELPPRVTDFPNVTNMDQLYTVGPIEVRSLCSHHFVPIIGHAWVGVIPSERVIGLSKFSRLTDWVMARPQIQEEATNQLADVIEEAINPLGLGVIVRAKHLCMSWRGVREANAYMTTSVMRGALREQAEARAEFLAFVRGGGK